MRNGRRAVRGASDTEFHEAVLQMGGRVSTHYTHPPTHPGAHIREHKRDVYSACVLCASAKFSMNALIN